MNSTLIRFAFVVVMGLLTAGAASGDLTVSVTITGPIEEIVPLLQHLKDLGVGAGAGPGGPVKLEIQSVATPEGQVKPAEPPPPPPKPPLALTDLRLAPPTAKPGGTVQITASVSDPDHLVDTVAATVDGLPGSAELYDNGAHGDGAAGDGVWGGTVTLPPQIAPGEHPVTVTAFNAQGGPVLKPVENQPPVPLTVQGKLVVQP